MSVFARILCGVDGSPAGFEALRQAKRLLAPGGRLLAVTVFDPEIELHAGWESTPLETQLREEADVTRTEAARELGGIDAEARLVVGRAIDCLLELADEEDATLIAVGSHSNSRAAGILAGSVTTALVHRALCPVLVARPAGPAAFPRAIVVGVDGLPHSLRAAAVAGELAERFGAALRTVAATGGESVDVDGLIARPMLEWNEQRPVDALLAASARADLLVVGSRGLHGFSALGSVSERVAHRARCSVLVVRPTAAALSGAGLVSGSHARAF